MFARQAGYLRDGRGARVRAAGRRTTTTPAPSRGSATPWQRVHAVTVPCNNDLLAGNFIDDGERVWLIDYEYSGMNDPAFELGNTATECEFTPEHDRGVDRGLLRRR